MAANELDRLLLLCGARRTGINTLASIMLPLSGEGLRWHGLMEPLDKLRLTSLHCEALGHPLAGMSWPALRGTLRLVTAITGPKDAPGCPIGGVVARALDSPDRTNDRDVDELRLLGVPGHEVWTLPHRLPTLQIRVTAAEQEALAKTWWWPLPESWGAGLRFARCGPGTVTA